ncbi:MAG: acyl-CoA dehydrogenase [Pseudohongiellaceae bacterium]|jgi:acyl-CoA dehydrogenase
MMDLSMDALMNTAPLLALASLSGGWLTLLGLVAVLTLGYLSARLVAWTAVAAVMLFAGGAGAVAWSVFGVLAVLSNVVALRRLVLTRPVLSFMQAMKFLPVISETERQAIEAGTVWVDGELFSGRPNLERLASEGRPELSDEEQAFLDGPTEEVCKMTNDWEIHQLRDLPQAVWDALGRLGFFGLIIPKKYGGLGFSATAHSAVVAKLSSRSMPLGITVMVPNSLGPAELLTHYGTDEQKAWYLPRLASGEDIPAFALTEPGAGSDAGSITADGVIFRDDNGELALRLNWNKRYITLAAVCTVLGLAFKLRDPDQLLGGEVDLGITCALVPSNSSGVELGKRHDPLGVSFINSPTVGRDVVVPFEAIIGGSSGVGRGWLMLMECLAAGRGISLPASSTAGVKLAARVTGAYAAVRQQFGMAIGKFEGIEEPLARIGGKAYLLDAARLYTTAGLDGGAKPAVVTAMAKYNFTELSREVVNDAMDIVGGAGISRGPRNLLATSYCGAPISITVEGANILTRTLMIFGQGAIRCHPYAYREVKAAGDNDLAAFDAAFWPHVGHVIGNGSRALLLTLTRGRLVKSPVAGPAAPYYRKIAWTSASFAFLADVAMASLGGNLKRKETIAGRFSDIFSWMYLGNAVLRRFEAEGRRSEDVPFMTWSMEYAFARIQLAFDGLYSNLDVPVLGAILAGPVRMWSRMNSMGSGPDDALGSKVARALQVPGAQRDRLTSELFIDFDVNDALGRLEHAFSLCIDAEAVAGKIKAAVRLGKLPRGKPLQLMDEAVAADIITAEEAELVARAEAARWDAVQVDSFPTSDFPERKGAAVDTEADLSAEVVAD